MIYRVKIRGQAEARFTFFYEFSPDELVEARKALDIRTRSFFEV